jgi:hypothetical protein
VLLVLLSAALAAQASPIKRRAAQLAPGAQGLALDALFGRLFLTEQVEGQMAQHGEVLGRVFLH